MALNGLRTLSKGLSELNLEREQLNAVEMYRDDIVLAQAEVLSEGKDKSGQSRADQYKPFTVQYKKEFGVGLGRVVDRVTFYMTGQLYQSLFAKITAKTFVVTSPLEKYDKMINRVGKENYGLDQKRIDYIRNTKIIPKLRDTIYSKTGIMI